MTLRDDIVSGRCSPDTLFSIIKALHEHGIESQGLYEKFGFDLAELNILYQHGTETFVKYMESKQQAGLKKSLRPYVVCLDTRWTKNLETVDMKHLDPDFFEPETALNGAIWEPNELPVFIDIITAASDEDARRIAGEINQYDPRCLFAIPVHFPSETR